MTAQRDWRGRGQDWLIVGGVRVETDAQRAALELMAPSLGAALSRSSRIANLIVALAAEIEAGAKEVDLYNRLPQVCDASATLDALADAPLSDGYDYRVLALHDVARRIGCAEAVARGDKRPKLSLDLSQLVDRARGAAMEALAGEKQS